jgi:hypothetical protein
LKITTQQNNTVTCDQAAYEIGARVPITPVIGIFASGFMGSKKMNGNLATLTSSTSGRADLSGF